MTVIHVGPAAELNVFEIKGNTEAERQTPMFGRGRLDHLALQAASLEAFETIRDRLMARGAADDFVTDFGPILSVFFRDPDGLECEVCVANPDAVPGVHNPPGTAPRATRKSHPLSPERVHGVLRPAVFDAGHVACGPAPHVAVGDDRVGLGERIVAADRGLGNGQFRPAVHAPVGRQRQRPVGRGAETRPVALPEGVAAVRRQREGS